MKAQRQRRQLPRIDLTPFVSVALVLITFFIWIEQLQQPVIVSGYTRFNCKCEYDEQLSATLFLLDHGRVGLLRYEPARDTASYLETDYSVGGLRTQLIRLVPADPAKRAVVTIIPLPQATVKNIVDIIDELTICRRIAYALAYEPTDRDYQIMANYQHYKSTNPQQSVFITLPPDQWRL